MMKRKLLPPADYLRERLSYDAATGELRWRTGRLAGKLTGQTAQYGYHKVFIDGVQFASHRLIWKMSYGTDPEFIDHVDGDRGNNSLANLRSGTRASNNKNCRLRSDNRFGTPGIRQRSATLWQARIKVDGRDIHLGNFRSKEEAVSARLKAQKEAGFAPTHGRAERPEFTPGRPRKKPAVNH